MTKLSWLMLIAAVLLFRCGGGGGDSSSTRDSSTSSSSPPPPPVSRGFSVEVSSADASSVRLKWAPIKGATEYAVMRDGLNVGRTLGLTGYFSDFGLHPGEVHEYLVRASDPTGAIVAESEPVSAAMGKEGAIRKDYTVLVLAFNPGNENLILEEVYLKHRIQFLELASLGSAGIHIYQGRIISVPFTPALVDSKRVDYRAMVAGKDLTAALEGYSIVDLIERGDIDHVWVVKAPAPVEFAENVLIGNRPIHGEGVTTGNTWTPIPVECSRSFFVNFYSSDERSYDAYAHMVEGIMTSLSDGHPENWPRDGTYTVYTPDCSSLETRQARLNVWERFRLADEWNGSSPVAYASKGNGSMGSSHFPPTSIRDCSDYAYGILDTWQRYIDSTADDWLSFPVLSNTKRKLGGYDFGGMNDYAEGDPSYSASLGTSPETHKSFRFARASFHQWWFAHLPHNPGVTDGKLNNWWPYIFDFNRFNGSRIEFTVDGFPEIPAHFSSVGAEWGTDESGVTNWGYWHSQNGFSPGGKAAQLRMVNKAADPAGVKAGQYAVKVLVENTQDWEILGFGRNDVFYPVSRNAHWNLVKAEAVRLSIKPGENADRLAGTNPIIRLCKNGGNRIEFVPRRDGSYANLFYNIALRDSEGWYNFTIPLAGDETWERNVIGYVDPGRPEAEKKAAKDQLEQDILSDVNYVEISVRSTTRLLESVYEVVSYYIDGLTFQVGDVVP